MRKRCVPGANPGTFVSTKAFESLAVLNWMNLLEPVSGQYDADENKVLQSGVPNNAVSPEPMPKKTAWLSPRTMSSVESCGVPLSLTAVESSNVMSAVNGVDAKSPMLVRR